MSSVSGPLRVAFLTHYFPPEIGAPQARIFELARRLSRGGDDVTVLTGFPNYPTGVVHEGYRGRFAMEENMDGVRVIRRWIFATPNAGFAKRILNHLSFALSSLTAWRALGPVDVLIVESPPLFTGLAALALSRLKRAPFIFNVSDVWPQSAVELGMLRQPTAIRIAEALEWHLYERAARVTVPTAGILEGLVARGLPRRKVFHLTNGVDVDIYQPGARDSALAESLGSEFGASGRKLFVYAGTHGLAQGLDVILEAARATRNPEVLYVLVGEGADKDALMRKAREQRIDNVVFLPNQPKASMPGLLNLAYAALITLKPLDVFRSALPTKMFEAMAAGRPIIASVSGEAADVVLAAGCGLVTEPGDPVAFRNAVEALASDPDRAREMGLRGREHAVEHFDRRAIVAQLRELLRTTVAA
jgi:glycosyltransferase involved in cell wall biosynthesis